MIPYSGMENEKRIIWSNVVKNILEVATYGIGGSILAAGAVRIIAELVELTSGKDIPPQLLFTGLVGSGLGGFLYGLVFYADTGSWRPVIAAIDAPDSQ